jgi:hypothetical protein
MTHSRFAALLATTLLACGGSDDGDENPGLTDEPCYTDCDRMAAVACVPDEYASACRTLCDANRKSVKDGCRDAFDAIYVCAVTKVTYSCDEKNSLRITPSGACAREASACAACNAGKLCLSLGI